MTDWHEDSAARSRRLRGEKTVEQRLDELERRLDAVESRRGQLKFSDLPDATSRPKYGGYLASEPTAGLPHYDSMRSGTAGVPDHDPLGR